MVPFVADVGVSTMEGDKSGGSPYTIDSFAVEVVLVGSRAVVVEFGEAFDHLKLSKESDNVPMENVIIDVASDNDFFTVGNP